MTLFKLVSCPSESFSFSRWYKAIECEFKPEISETDLKWVGELSSMDDLSGFEGCKTPQKTLLILGPTRVGKSAMVNWLNGTRYVHEAGRLTPIPESEPEVVVSKQSTASVTKSPTITYLKKDPDTVVVDCPGFGDTEGNDLKWAFSISTIIERFKPNALWFMLTCDNFNIDSGVDNKFIGMLRGIASCFLGDLDEISKARFIFNKTEHGSGKPVSKTDALRILSGLIPRLQRKEFGDSWGAFASVGLKPSVVLEKMMQNQGRNIEVFDPTSITPYAIHFSLTPIDFRIKVINDESLQRIKRLIESLRICLNLAGESVSGTQKEMRRLISSPRSEASLIKPQSSGDYQKEIVELKKEIERKDKIISLYEQLIELKESREKSKTYTFSLFREEFLWSWPWSNNAETVRPETKIDQEIKSLKTKATELAPSDCLETAVHPQLHQGPEIQSSLSSIGLQHPVLRFIRRVEAFL